MTTKKRQTMSPEQRRQKAEKLQAAIADQVEALRDSEQWTAFLDYLRSFHTYSLNNVLLMLAQNPDAAEVAGFRQWQEKGRQVRKGETGMKIFGWASKKTSEDEAAQREAHGTRVERNANGAPIVHYFPMLTVFDVAQTDPIDGEPERSSIAHRLTGDDEAAIAERVTAWLARTGWSVEREHLTRANGYTTTDGSHRVVVAEGLSPAQTAKTLLHEAGHVLLHSAESIQEYAEHRGIKETEAESVAYVAAGLLGLDTSAYSIGYIAGWSKGDTDTIRSTAARVLSAVHTLADALSDQAAEQVA